MPAPVGELPPGAFFIVTVAYTHQGETWYDEVPWTRDTSWILSEHSYLQELSDDSQYQWSVQVVQQTGVDASGQPIGVPLSLASDVRTLLWRRAGGGDDAPPGTPPVPPP